MHVSLAMVRQAVSLVGGLADLEQPDGFAGMVLPGLDRLVGSDVLTYNEVGAAHVRYADYPAAALDPATQVIFEAHVHEHPLISHYRATGSGEAVKISDFLSQRQFHRLGLYAEFYRPIPVEHQIAISMLGPDGEVIGIALNRERADFTETDRAVLSLLCAPLMAGLQRARNRQRAHSALGTAAPASLATLTDREMQVLERVAQGATNAAIAHTLQVSPRTIAKHLEHIYRKLGVTSRAAAAAQSAAQPRGSPASLSVCGVLRPAGRGIGAYGSLSARWWARIPRPTSVRAARTLSSCCSASAADRYCPRRSRCSPTIRRISSLLAAPCQGLGGVRPAALGMLASGDTPSAWSWSASSRAQVLRSVNSRSSSAWRACDSRTLRLACLTSRMASMTSLSTWLRAAAGSSRGGRLTAIPMRAGGPGTREAGLLGYATRPGTSLSLLSDRGSSARLTRMKSAW
jgi:DNA-binding CsgD family transcriptional regulator